LARGAFPGGAALTRAGAAWVLVEDRPDRALGGALLWADRQGASSLDLLAESGTGLLARRAALFAAPVTVWRVDDRELRPARPDPYPPEADVPEPLRPLRATIVASGAEPVVEHGVLSGEVAGLEICRAVFSEDGAPRLDVGIGAHDREAFALVHGRQDDVGPVLAELVRTVAAHRRPGAAPHALNRLGRERYLRGRLIADPGLVGLTELRPAAPPVPRTNLKDPVPCVALGRAPDGAPVVVVCSAGVDLDLVPFGADARAAVGHADARLVLAVPEGDDHPALRSLAARLVRPADVVAVPAERSDASSGAAPDVGAARPVGP